MKKKITLLAMAILTSISCNALNYFWVGGSGVWSDYNNHWATTSGGSTFHNQWPQSTDNVFFDTNSFTATGANGTMFLDYTGGIVQASNSTFRNNYIDVEFKPYAAPLNYLGNEPNNRSGFSSCTFIGDAVLNDPAYTIPFFGGRITTDKHVILRQVKGITFTGNTFKTDLTSLGSGFATLARSYGIYSIDASFTVHPACNIINAVTGECAGAINNFVNLYHGVYAQSSNPLKSFTVNQTSFTNCYYSLYQGGINNSVVTKNTFLINL